jgi:hypothetical protein
VIKRSWKEDKQVLALRKQKKARRSGMTKGTVGAVETGSKYNSEYNSQFI